MSEEKTLTEKIEERLQSISELPEEFILMTSIEWEISVEGYEIITREEYERLLKGLSGEGSISLHNLPGHAQIQIPYSALVDAFKVYKTSAEAVHAFRETLEFYSIGYALASEVLSGLVWVQQDGD